MTAALVALGSNVPPRRAHLERAAAALAALDQTRLLRCAAPVETAPVDCPPGSGPFLNGACLLATRLPPRALLDRLLAIEERMGRVRGVRHAPRTIDLDLVLYGDRVVREPGLTVPHPRAHERSFVLVPAAAIAPDMVHPVLGRTLAELREALAHRERAAADAMRAAGAPSAAGRPGEGSAGAEAAR